MRRVACPQTIHSRTAPIDAPGGGQAGSSGCNTCSAMGPGNAQRSCERHRRRPRAWHWLPQAFPPARTETGCCIEAATAAALTSTLTVEVNRHKLILPQAREAHPGDICCVSPGFVLVAKVATAVKHLRTAAPAGSYGHAQCMWHDMEFAPTQPCPLCSVACRPASVGCLVQVASGRPLGSGSARQSSNVPPRLTPHLLSGCRG